MDDIQAAILGARCELWSYSRSHAQLVVRVRITNGTEAFLVAVLIGLWAGAASATSILWYNGDANGKGSLLSEVKTIDSTRTAMVYDDFIVPAGSGWNVREVWANEDVTFADILPTTASWEIRSGVSFGNGGTLVASGIDPCSATSTGRTPTGAPDAGPPEPAQRGATPARRWHH